MDNEIRHNCGLCVTHTLHDAYSFIKSLQHRGREAAGIAAIGNKKIDVIKWAGQVDKLDIKDLHKIFKGHKYHTYLAHVRYATRGKKEQVLKDAHPRTIGGKTIDRGNHILVLGCDAVMVHNGQVDGKYCEGINTESKGSECDTDALLRFFREKGELEILKQIPFSYTLAVADIRRNDVIVLRDRTGMKPGVLGWKDGKHVVASEDIALRKNGGHFLEDLDPGSVYYLGFDGDYRKEKVVNPRLAYCYFEYNYICDVESTVNLVSVQALRIILGKMLSTEFIPEDADLVTFLPRCPEAAAREYARISGLPFEFVFYKLKGERSFLGSTAIERKISIDENLFLLLNDSHAEEYLKDKVVVLIDDSTIRGNNSRRALHWLYEVGKAKKVYLVNYTPPVGIIPADGIPRGCDFGGVDMPSSDNFIARGRTFEEISAEMKTPVRYISVEGMLRGFETAGIPREHLCTYCIGGKYPLK